MTSDYIFALLGLGALVALVAGVLLFAAVRFLTAARRTTRHLSENGAERAFLTVALQDAVARLRAQEQAMSARAQASERLSEEIVASLTAGLLVVNEAGIVQILNPAGRRLLSLGERPIPMPYRDLLASALPLADAIDECLESGQPIVRRALRLPHPARDMHLGITVSPMAGSRGHQGAICLFSDLTSVVDLEEQLRLKEALARLGELTAGIAHEFRNGLATIHGYSRLIDPGALPQGYRPYIEGIRQETEALGRVVTNFLNFARPERPALLPVDLAAVVQRAVEDVRPELTTAGAAIEIRGSFATIEGDDVLLRQMLLNLLRNALEACREASMAARIVIEGQLDREQGLCRLTVDDNGPGIAPDARERIFRPFFTTRAAGTGLGLAIVQKIAVTHNGRIAVASSPAGGASFQVTLPVVLDG